MKVYQNFSLQEFNAYKIKSFCRIAYFPENEEDFIKLFSLLDINNFIIIGNGNNLILSKEYYTTPFIILNGTFNKVEVDNNYLIAEASATTLDICKIALLNNLSGIEFLYDIPSSVGGAVFMNAGTKEGVIEDVLYKVRYLDLIDLSIKEIYKDELNLSYRNSFFQEDKNKIILKAWFKLIPGDNYNIENLMDSIKKRRWSKQPREFPNCGSVFKRPPGKYVGPMIDELKLRGYTVGGAQISNKHSGFIVNINNATGENILNLIDIVKLKVLEKFNLNLEVEQRII
ncbi:UDP-N-acetylmuramate dehydrogenase [Croceibacter atlanticus]|uniref:UDP-N-acetylmuramate dehydrogenase n=1 Tax=Croceibacter atlanticus TaxID=313588 RepID=UPI002E133449|nr:UDP-N-acetylmuramate dehydrogenase [Croceibacter atlanticus]